MKQLFLVLFCVLLLASCFKNMPLEPAEHFPIDSLCHYYSIELNEADSMVHVEFLSWPMTNRDKRLLIPAVDKVEINGQILNLENNSYKLNIPIQKLKDEIITISYFSSDTVFYLKRIKLARFYSCKLDFDRDMFDDSIGVYFEPALNTFEELDIELIGQKRIHKKLSYNESIQNGISFKENLAMKYGIKNTNVPTIILKKLYEEKYTQPMSIQINTSTMIERRIEDVPVIYTE